MHAPTHTAARRALTLGLVGGAWLFLAALTPGDEAGSPYGDASAGVEPAGIQVAQAVSSAEAAVDMAAMVAAAAGQTVSLQCLGCHTLGEGEGTRVGPNLHGIVGRPVGSVAGFRYSDAMAAIGAGGGTWTIERLSAFLQSPQAAIPGTMMGYLGIEDDATRANLIAYLATLGGGEQESAEGANAGPMMSPVSYAADQAERGQTRYVRECEECHGEDLRGGLNGGPPLRGLGFEQKYANGTPASVLYLFMSTNMPPQSPGRFSATAYADLMAFILQQLGFAAGDPLPSDIDALGLLSMER